MLFLAAPRVAPFAFSWSHHGASRALQLPVEALNLPMDMIRCAAARIQSSPLAGLVTGHIVDLAGDADRIARDPCAASVSIEPARALISSPAGDRAGPGQRDTLACQVREYVRQNLTDPDLGAPKIAAAHFARRFKSAYGVTPGGQRALAGGWSPG